MNESLEKISPPRDPARGTEKTANPKPTPVQRWKRPAIAVAAFMLSFAGGFLWAKVAGNQALSEAKSEYEKTLSSKQVALKESDTALTQAQSRTQLLSAYRDLHLALMALEERNFGTASRHLQQAGQRLAEVSEPGARAQEAQIAHEVGAAISAWKPDVSDDVGKQRDTVLGFASRLDSLLGEGSN